MGELVHKQMIDGLLSLAIVWFIGIQYDKMRFYAYHDDPTEIYNRRFALNMFSKRSARSSYSSLAVFMVGVSFQRDNRFGHKSGDCTLKRLSMLLDHTRKSDMLVR